MGTHLFGSPVYAVTKVLSQIWEQPWPGDQGPSSGSPFTHKDPSSLFPKKSGKHFENLKGVLSHSYWGSVDEDEPFAVVCDASNVAILSALKQESK